MSVIVQPSELLPKTVKDKDGNDLELLAVSVDDEAMRKWMLGLSDEPARIVMYVRGPAKEEKQ